MSYKDLHVRVHWSLFCLVTEARKAGGRTSVVSPHPHSDADLQTRAERREPDKREHTLNDFMHVDSRTFHQCRPGAWGTFGGGGLIAAWIVLLVPHACASHDSTRDRS